MQRQFPLKIVDIADDIVNLIANQLALVDRANFLSVNRRLYHLSSHHAPFWKEEAVNSIKKILQNPLSPYFFAFNGNSIVDLTNLIKTIPKEQNTKLEIAKLFCRLLLDDKIEGIKKLSTSKKSITPSILLATFIAGYIAMRFSKSDKSNLRRGWDDFLLYFFTAEFILLAIMLSTNLLDKSLNFLMNQFLQQVDSTVREGKHAMTLFSRPIQPSNHNLTCELSTAKPKEYYLKRLTYLDLAAPVYKRPSF